MKIMDLERRGGGSHKKKNKIISSVIFRWIVELVVIP